MLIANLLIVGCASNPPAKQTQLNPNPDSATTAMMGLLLLSVAGQDTNSAARAIFEVRISAPAREVINAIADYRRKIGKWPTQADIALPAAVKEAGVKEVGGNLEVEIKCDDASSFRCGIEPDGTVVVLAKPQFLSGASGTNAMRRIGR